MPEVVVLSASATTDAPSLGFARRVWALLRPERWHYARGLTALFTVNLSDALAPVFMAVAVELTSAALTGKAPETPQLLRFVGLESARFSIGGAVGVYLGLMLLANVARYPMLIYTAIPSHRLGQTLRRAIAGRLLEQSQTFYDRAKSGDLMSLATSDINAVRMMMGPGVLVGCDTVFLIGLVLLVMCSLSWELTLVAMIPLPVIALVTNYLSHAEHDRFQEVQEDVAALTERVRQSYAGIRLIQAYAREAYDRARFEEHSWRHYAKNLRLARVHSVFDPTLDLMLGASTALVFTFGGLKVARGELGLGTFVAFLFLVGFLSGPMVGFGWAVSLWQRGKASLGRIDRFLGVPVAIHDAPGAEDVEPGPQRLEVRGLTFAYPKGRELGEGEDAFMAAYHEVEPGEEVLRDVSFVLEPGCTLGIVGAVGSGKSTIARLLTRLYEPPAGTVLLGGRDVRDVPLDALRRRVVLAPQDTFLFGTTVTQNVLMGSADAARADAARYARQAALHDEIEALPDKYETLLGERGVNLSGGQRQRLAIARAIAADPEILILDDCLSAVDARTEEAILAELGRVFAERGGIIISHRVRAVERCDEIVVLEQGRVVERGTHAALLARGGFYARIAQAQTREGGEGAEEARG
jgi:ATP-binding cassette subfamily B protein